MNRTYPKKWLFGAFAFCLAFWMAVGYSAFAQTAQPGPGAPPQGPYSYYQLQAQKILRNAALAQAISINTAPPAISLESGTFAQSTCNASGSWNIPTILPSDTRITTNGGLAATSDGTNWSNQDASTNTAALTTGGQAWSQTMWVYALCLDVNYNNFSGAGPLRIKVDNQYTNSIGTTLTPQSGNQYIRLDFNGGTSLHKVEFDYAYADNITGYNVNTAGLVWASDEASNTTKAVWLGDSYVYQSVIADPASGLPYVLGQVLGIRHIIPSGQSGQGWVVADPTYSRTFGQRITSGDLTRFGNLDLVILQCSINDHAQSAGTITAAVAAGAATAFAQHPESIFLIISGYTGGSSEQNNATANTACVSGFTSAVGYNPARTVIVNGYSDTPIWTLVAAMTSDNIHPNSLGVTYLNSRTVNDALAGLRAIAGTTQ